MRIGRWERVQSISFPRSGHEYISELAERYFGPQFIYRNDFSDPYPAGVHFQKGHDLNLSLQIDPTMRYLVQIRDPFESIFSWHKMTVHNDGVPDTPEAFRDFLRDRVDYWAGFVKKWVASPMRNRLVIHYADLVDHPKEALFSIVKFFGESPSEQRIRDVIRSLPAKERRWPVRIL